jgi:hypothetical protein
MILASMRVAPREQPLWKLFHKALQGGEWQRADRRLFSGSLRWGGVRSRMLNLVGSLPNSERIVPVFRRWTDCFLPLCLSQIRSAWLGTANRAMKLVHVGPAQPDQVVAP